MTEAAERLRWRREALLRRADVQRQQLRGHLQPIGAAVDRADRGLALVRRVATPPVVAVAGIALALLLGRGRARAAVATGLTVLGLFLRARSAGQVLSRLARGQAVSRSR
ncbi:MAG: YqjK-like family protein [Gammaproteobacteria bacterium]|nr:YqjK-like family protein [Gammaproteobacteria bacterium]